MNRSIGILHYWGGYPRMANSYWQNLCRLLRRCAERDWRTYMVWSQMPADEALCRPLVECGCRIIVQPRPSAGFDWRCVVRTVRMLRGLRCDVFHCHNRAMNPLIAAALAGVPVRVWSKLSMSPYYERDIEPRGIHRLAPSLRVSCALSHHVIPISKAVQDELVGLGISASGMTIIPLAVDLARYSSCSGGDVRERLGLAGSDLVITAVGHAVPVKGWDILINAFAAVAKRIPSARLVLVGSCDGRVESQTFRELQSLAEHLDVAHRLQFTGRCDDVPEILSASDIFAFPSRSEGQGLALVEACACGLPCAASRAGGSAEIITDNKNGLLFDREDVSGLAHCLMTLAGDEALRRRLGENALNTVQGFTIDGFIDRVISVYEKLLARTELL